MKTLARILIALLPIMPAWAAETPRYDVEIVVFEQVNGPDDEAQPLAEDTPDLVGAWDPSRPPSDPSTRLLSTSEYRLNAVARRLERGQDYQVLLHTAWRQDGLPRDKAFKVRLRAGEDMGPQLTTAARNLDDNYWTALEHIRVPDRPVYELDGTVTISLSRYLHADFDLALAEVGMTEVGETGMTTRVPELQVQRLEQHRRMRSEHLHYIDHPRLGVLIKIFPVEDQDR